MSQRPVLCCPTPAINTLLPNTRPGESNKVPTTPGYACENPLYIINCGDAVTPPAPTPITATGADCAGAPVTVSGNPGELMTIVQAAGTVFKVQTCDPSADRELVKRCDPVTGAEVLFQWDVTVSPPVLLSATDLTTGAPWAGDPKTLTTCGGSGLESDPEVFCDGTNTFYRWFVKKDGVPTGVTFDTTLTGIDYVPLGPVTPGVCVTAIAPPEISDAFGDDLSTLLPSDNFIFDASTACSSPPCVYQIVTDAGTFRVRAGSAITTKTFSSKVTVQSVSVLSGGCSLADLHIIGNSN